MESGIGRKWSVPDLHFGSGKMKSAVLTSGLLATALLVAACGARQVGFKADVEPIVKQYCLECHAPGGQGALASGLDMSSYEALLKGTRYGSIVKPGDSLSSVLIMLVEGRANPAIKMPHGKAELPKDKIAILRTWVDQGAKNN